MKLGLKPREQELFMDNVELCGIKHAFMPITVNVVIKRNIING